MQIVLPSGFIITAAVFTKPWELSCGLMGVPSMPVDHGALFVHPRTSLQPYWTFGCNFPLDIAWLDGDLNVVELCPNVAPCPSAIAPLINKCPHYGGNVPSRYVLEVNGGVLARHWVEVGCKLVMKP